MSSSRTVSARYVHLASSTLRSFSRNIIWLRHLLCVLLLLSLTACASDTGPRPSFTDPWHELAKNAQGHRPDPAAVAPRPAPAAQPRSDRPSPSRATPVKRLPGTPVTLKMHNVDINLIIQALARAARQNIIINSSVSGVVSIDIRRVPWNEAFTGVLRSNGLTYAWEGDLIRVISVQDLKRDMEIATLNETRRTSLEPLLMQMVPVRFVTADKLKGTLLPFLGGEGKQGGRGGITVDANTNALIIQATEDRMTRILDLISRLDRPTDQIKLRAFIIETTRTTGRELGIQWGGNGAWSDNTNLALGGPVGSGGSSFGDGASGSGFGVNFPIDAATGSGIGTAGAGINAVIGSVGENVLELQLTALEDDGKVNILSNPSIITMDNQMAYTESGARVPYVTVDSDGDQEVKFEDAVLRLEITPHVIDDRYLKLNIIVKNDDVDFSSTVEGNPLIRKKQTKTSVIVENNETVVISGLNKRTVTSSESGVPGMKDIPGLGWAFKGNADSEEMQEVLIFVTPHILPVRNPDNAAAQAMALDKAVETSDLNN